MVNIRSADIFNAHWFCWTVLGAAKERVRYKDAYALYAVILNLLVTVCYPLHLMLALFASETQADNFKNLAVSVTCLACSSKFIIYVLNLRKVYHAEEILAALDARVQCTEDREYFRQIRRSVRNIAYVFYSVYLPVGVTAELSFLFSGERRLLYPAWFPFDWRHSVWWFSVANVYQIVGISYQLIQNFVGDSFPPMAMCLLSGHIRLLGRRVARIGYEGAEDSVAATERELKLCIEDQNNLYALFDTIQSIVSIPMLIQFAVTAINICIAMVALLFYVDTPIEILYYVVYFVSMPLEIFPTCYYGSDFQNLFSELNQAIYSCNWMDQSHSFKKHVILFMERSLRETTAVAGGMVRIHLDTFFSTCKGAYSLFAVIMRMKD